MPGWPLSVIVIRQWLAVSLTIEALMESPGSTVIDGITFSAAGRISHQAL